MWAAFGLPPHQQSGDQTPGPANRNAFTFSAYTPIKSSTDRQRYSRKSQTLGEKNGCTLGSWGGVPEGCQQSYFRTFVGRIPHRVANI